MKNDRPQLSEQMDPGVQDRIMTAMVQLQNTAMSISEAKGFWPKETDGMPSLEHRAMKIALMHSELSEALDAMRNGNAPSIELFAAGISGEEEELADTMIRILDYAGKMGYNLGRTMLYKMNYNLGREQKHGKEF